MELIAYGRQVLQCHGACPSYWGQQMSSPQLGTAQGTGQFDETQTGTAPDLGTETVSNGACPTNGDCPRLLMKPGPGRCLAQWQRTWMPISGSRV